MGNRPSVKALSLSQFQANHQLLVKCLDCLDLPLLVKRLVCWDPPLLVRRLVLCQQQRQRNSHPLMGISDCILQQCKLLHIDTKCFLEEASVNGACCAALHWWILFVSPAGF